MELGWGLRAAELEAYVRFANGYSYAPMTSMSLMVAINLAMTGENAFGTADELLRMSHDPDFYPEPRLGRHFAKLKGASKKGGGGFGGGTRSSSLKMASGTSAPKQAQSMTAVEALNARRLAQFK